MALLSEVVTEFQKNFQYLNKNHQRQSSWYEFWHSDSFKSKFTNCELTQKLEEAAKSCMDSLNDLVKGKDNVAFADYQDQFFSIISQAFHCAQVQRFTHGSIETERYQQGHQSILERSVVAKSPGKFEEQMTKAVIYLAKKFLEHQDFFNQLSNKIQASELSPYVFFQESRKIDSNGKFYYSERGNIYFANDLHKMNPRSKFANEHINTLQM